MKKNRPSLDERRAFALQINASFAFETVVDMCKYLLNTPVAVEHPSYQPTVVAIYVTYGRPFTSSWGFGKLGETHVPAEHKAAHDDLMKNRDKHYAHSDKNLVHEQFGPMNDIRIHISHQGELKVWTQPVLATPKQIERVLPLARRMHEKMEYRTDKFMKKYIQRQVTDAEFPPGHYLLDTENEQGFFVRRDDADANEEHARIRRAISQYASANQRDDASSPS